MKGTIYKITNLTNGRVYVGGTTQYNRRKYQHIWHLNNKSHHNHKLQKDWDELSKDNFIFSIIEQVEEGLKEKEQELLNKLDYSACYNISNLSTGGDFIKTFTEERQKEIRDKISNTKKKQNIKPNNRKQVSVMGVIYESFTDASKAINIPVVTIRYRCLSYNLKYIDWNIIGEEKDETKMYKEQEARGKVIVCNNVEFPFYSEAASQLNMSITAIQNRVKSSNYPECYIK